ncbi:MAG: MBL fold metallo-hydrolase, partial [Phocaeicola sp.]
MTIKFISIGSGSSGNAYYLGTETDAILIDAGVGIRSIKKGLKERGISMEMIRA